ncbi:hypothetical protein GN956_G19904 [Arapaima gigas]
MRSPPGTCISHVFYMLHRWTSGVNRNIDASMTAKPTTTPLLTQANLAKRLINEAKQRKIRTRRVMHCSLHSPFPVNNVLFAGGGLPSASSATRLGGRTAGPRGDGERSNSGTTGHGNRERTEDGATVEMCGAALPSSRPFGSRTVGRET